MLSVYSSIHEKQTVLWDQRGAYFATLYDKAKDELDCSSSKADSKVTDLGSYIQHGIDQTS